jgi:hypothetical protein
MSFGLSQEVKLNKIPLDFRFGHPWAAAGKRIAGFDLLVMPCHHSLGPATRVTEEPAQLGVCNDNVHALSNGTSENRNLVAQTPEFDIGEISGNLPNGSSHSAPTERVRGSKLGGCAHDKLKQTNSEPLPILKLP